MPQPKIKKTVVSKEPAITTRIRKALEKTAQDLQCSADGLNISPGEKLIDVVVAFSGGLDSTTMLYAASRLKGKSFGKIIAVHVHHGLSKNADSWAEFCKAQAKKFGVDFVLKKVSVPVGGDGIEAEARKARYRVLEEEAAACKADAILTAHHLDDQLETFLIQWMRGAGLEGLSGMPPVLYKETSVIARPFLGFQRKELEEFAEKRRLKWIEDESNTDTTFLRNAIRLNVIPEMEMARRGFKHAAARSIEIIAESVEILKEVAESDLDRLQEKGSNALLLDEFLSLSQGRQSRLLRLWLEKGGFKPLSRNRILEVIRQIQETQKQSVCLIYADGLELRKYGARLMLRPREKTPGQQEFIFQWKGEPEIELKDFNGKLVFTPSEEGFNEGYLKSEPLIVKARAGGEKIKIHKFRPRKMLKVLYQEAGIPEFERKNLPLVWRDKTLIYAAGLGAEVREQVDDDGTPRYRMEFIKNPDLFA